ncbi:MAG: hypothetical protein HXS48_24185 [Theionarchaea archaeon]|nr:MAG: hypothetical protein AYK19_00170 [Theionarchaea archaeon DG-70-1]MBU7030053.1 hypothetical protein [Theionarchaea archaeon]
MVSLGEVLGALISQVNKGRAQADIETLKVAEVYKEEPLLSSFSIPRMVLDEVVVDLKVSVVTGPSRGVSFTPESRLKILESMEKLIDSLPKKYRHIHNIRRDADIWEPTRTRISGELSEIVPAEIEVKPKSVTMSATAAIQRQLVQALLHPKSKATRRSLTSFVQEDAPQMEKYLKSEMEKVIEEVIKSQPPPKERLEVLVSVSDLEKIPPDKITNVRLTLRESDLSWTKVETKDGKIEKKLIPF